MEPEDTGGFTRGRANERVIEPLWPSAKEKRRRLRRRRSGSERDRGALAIALAGVLVWQVYSRSPAPSENVAADQKILQQMQVLFPRQVNAIVEDNGKVDLSVTQSPELGSDQPIVVLFQRHGQTIRVLSYSGHKFSLPLDGRERHFEILATSEGGVILEEDDQAWLLAGNPKIAGYSVRAQTLEVSL